MQIRKLSVALGAEISGIDLHKIGDADFAEIRAAFLDHHVLVFREQSLSLPDQVAFSERWGEVQINPIFPYVEGYPGVLQVDNMGKQDTVTENWHYDSTFSATPPALTILSMVSLPPLGGDTMWSNQYAAYDQLTGPMRGILDGLRGVFAGTRVARAAGGKEVPTAVHPIVRTHPETGRKALYIGNPDETLECFEGMTRAESQPILRFLYEHSVKPDNIYRHVWRERDVAMWDNRCTMHYAVHDYGDAERRLYRTTINGDAPR